MRNNTMHQTTDIAFKTIVDQSFCYADICRNLNLRLQGSNYRTIKNRIKRQHLSVSHFNTSYTKASKLSNTIPLSNILVENSNYGSNPLKKRLLKENILKNECLKCKLSDMWNGERIILQLDHINGNHRDNRLENLRILCPNCHSQTNTHSGKRHKKIYYCVKCQEQYPGYGMCCKKCKLESPSYKIQWPTNEILSDLIWKFPLSHVGKQLSCSSNAIKDYCESKKIKLPEQGYWQRKNAGHCHETSLTKIKTKTRIPMKIWKEDELLEIVKLKNEGNSFHDIALKFHVAHTTISRQYKKFIVGGNEGSRTLS